MKNAFTLVELLVVIGIMGLLGTISVGGYRAMQRGMEERGVMQTVNTLAKAAYERAQIDRLPTAIYYWNETLRTATEDENEIVIGHAVAVRPHGRVSRVDGGDLVDEFGDLDKVFPKLADAEEGGEGGSADEGDNTIYLYQLDTLGSANVQLKRSIVGGKVIPKTRRELYLQIGGYPSDNAGNGDIETWAFKMVNANGATWRTGSCYGMEFAEITLPRNYIFGSSYSKNVEQPVAGEGTVSFSVGRATGNGAQGGASGTIAVYSLRPDGSGGLKAEKVGDSENPY